jgi:predicted phosphoribosyltransferase
VAYEAAASLGLPLDVFVVRKLGVPGHEELAMGAIASGGVRVLNRSVVDRLNIADEVIGTTAHREEAELRRREALYREHRAPLNLAGQTVILIDDGLATGSTMRAAVDAVHQLRAARVVVAVPVASPETCAEFATEVDDVVCPLTPGGFTSVGQWYADFAQTSDEEVRHLLAESIQV